ncbi:MAG: serine/threonine-protein kinase [Planctomycetota bacterium]
MDTPRKANNNLSLEDRVRIDELCNSFEDELCQAENSRDLLESQFRSVEGSREFLGSLLLELLCIEMDYRRSRHDSLILVRYLDRFPKWEDVVHEAWERRDVIDLHPGDRIDEYEIIEQLGSGAFSNVYSAKDANGSIVALKLQRMVSEESDRPETGGLRELGPLQRLSHPNIIELQGHGRTESGELYLIMPRISETLRSELQAGPLSIDRAASVAQQITAALQYAHAQGVIHCDLSPSNVMIDAKGDVVLGDFGLSIQKEEQRLRWGEIVGSPSYMSPEQIRGESQWLDGRADIWSVGVLLYEMLTGALPYEEGTLDALSTEIDNRRPQPPRQLRPSVPAELEETVLRCLQSDQADRFATASDLYEALGESRPSVSSPTEQRSVPKIAFASIACAIAIVGLVGWFLYVGIGSTSPTLPVDPDALANAAASLNDFDFEVRQDLGLSTKPVDDRERLELKDGAEILLQVRAERVSYLHVVSYESGKVKPNVMAAGAQAIAIGSEDWETLLPIIPVAADGDELLLLVASNMRLNAAFLGQLERGYLSEESPTDAVRGLKFDDSSQEVGSVPDSEEIPSESLQLAAMLLTYRVTN